MPELRAPPRPAAAPTAAPARRTASSQRRSDPGSSSPRSRSHRPRRAGTSCSGRSPGRPCARPAARRRARRRGAPGADPRCRPTLGLSTPLRSSSCGVLSAPAATTTAPARTVCRSPASSTYSTPVASESSISTRSTVESARSSSTPCASASWMYVFIVDLPAFVAQPWRHEPQLMQFASVYAAHRLELQAERTEAGLDRVHALQPVGPLAHAEHVLHAVVVRLEVGRRERLAVLVRQSGRRMPLGDVVLLGAQRHLAVDGGRAADAASCEEGDDVAVGKRRQTQRPPDVVIRSALPTA